MFPLFYLNNEMLAGVCQRVSAKGRRQLELVNGRVAAVTQKHGSIYWRELDIQLTNPCQFGFMILRNAVYSDEAAVTVCGLQLNSVGDLRKAVRAMVARCRISRLRISTQGYDCCSDFGHGVPKNTQKSLSSAFADLSTNPRVRPLRAIAIVGDSDVVQLFGEAGGGIAQLLTSHAATVNELELRFSKAKSDAHTQLHGAAASCVNVQRFDVIIADDSGSAAAIACIAQYKQLKALAVNRESFILPMDAYGLFEALPRPTQLKELSLKNVALLLELPGDMAVRADVFASLRTFKVRDRGSESAAEFVAQLADICPHLEQLCIDGCDDVDWPSLQSLVQRYFASTSAHDLRVELAVNAPSQWPNDCADLATNWRADVADLSVACSDADLCAKLDLQSLQPAAQTDAADATAPKSSLSAECPGEHVVVFELVRGEAKRKRALVLELREWRDPSVSSVDYDEDDDAFADYDAGDFDDDDIDDDY